MRLSHRPHSPTQRVPLLISSKAEYRGAPGESEETLLKLLLTLTGTETECSEHDWILIRKKKGVIKTFFKAGIQQAWMSLPGNQKKNAILATG